MVTSVKFCCWRHRCAAATGDGVIDIDECTYILRSLDPVPELRGQCAACQGQPPTSQAFFTQEKVRQLAAKARKHAGRLAR